MTPIQMLEIIHQMRNFLYQGVHGGTYWWLDAAGDRTYELRDTIASHNLMGSYVRSIRDKNRFQWNKKDLCGLFEKYALPNTWIYDRDHNNVEALFESLDIVEKVVLEMVNANSV